MWRTGYYGFLADYLWWWAALASLLLHTCCFFRLFPRQRHPRLRLVLGNLLVTACMLTGIGLAGESYFRFASAETDAYGASLTCRRWHAAYARLNSLGHRDHEWSEKKPAGVRRIAFVGDSFTYGWGINNVKDRFSNIIQRRFEQLQPGTVEVMNVAWNNWDTLSELKWIQRINATYAVDEVVLCYLPNDMEKIVPVAEDFNPARPPRSTLIRTDGSFLLDSLYYRVYVPRVPTVVHYFDWLADAYKSETIWQEQESNLGLIISACRDYGVTLRVALLPFLRTSGERYKPERIHARLRRFFDANDVPLVDLLPAVAGYGPNELTVNAHDAHPNELANRLFAEAIWNAFYAKSVFGKSLSEPRP